MKFAVLGAGCGGQTFAGHLASQGHAVKLYNRSIERIRDLMPNSKITLEGAINAEGKVDVVTTEIGEAVRDAEVIMVATTALGHGDVAKWMAPYLSDGQIIVLNPGRSFGALEVANEIYSQRPDLDITICEANTLLYATRVVKPGRAQVFGVKQEVSVAALRPHRTEGVLDMLKEIFPQMKPAKNILETSIGNIGAVFHPTIMLFNQERVKSGAYFDFYRTGVTEGIAWFMEKLDKERLDIAKALGTEVPSIRQWLRTRYNLQGDTLFELLQENPSYKGLGCPDTLQHRYILEDIPTGLVPLSLVGQTLGTKTECMDYLIGEAQIATENDMVDSSRTLEKLGLTRENLKEDIAAFFAYQGERKYG